MSGSNTSSNPNPPPFFWNPGVPEQLLLPSSCLTEESKDDTTTTTPKSGEPTTVVRAKGIYFTGVGCNNHELMALDRMLEAHEDFFNYYDNLEEHVNDNDGEVDKRRRRERKTKQTQQQRNSNDNKVLSLKHLSQQYREAVRDCLAGWDESLRQQRQSLVELGESDLQQQLQELYKGEENLDLLKASYNIMHLLDVFLPLLTQHAHVADAFHYGGDPFDQPGVATADLVRYLRYNHLKDPKDNYPLVDEMLESHYPEEFEDQDGILLFWRYVETLVLRGCLEEAWHVLSKHSSFTQAMLKMQEDGQPQDPFLASALEEIILDFQELRDILLRAPLPSGRTEQFDNAFTSAIMIEDIQDTDFTYAGEDFGVNPSDYKYWEMNSNEMILGDGNHGEPTFLESNAFRKFKLWQEHVAEQRHSLSLARRIPQIDSILAILEGDFSKVNFTSWAENFCAEVLYRKPNLAPRNFSTSAQRIISKYHDHVQPLLKAMLSIMEGDVGTAIYVIWLMGGASGAALPSTITTLLYSLFQEAGILYGDSSSEDRLPEFLCNSAASILSSVEDLSIGASQAIRLLIPYALQEGNPVIVSSISNILEHHFPLTDASARNMISMCRPLVDRLSAEVLDGCCAIVLARYRYYTRIGHHGDAVFWLRRGMELEAVVLPVESLGPCYRTLVMECLRASRELALLVLGKVEANATASVVAQSMIEGLQGEPHDVAQIPAVQLLHAIFACYEGENSRSELGGHIVSCLQQTIDESNGTVRRTFVPISFHWYLLQIAETLVREDEEIPSYSAYPTECAFDKTGVALLMERLMQFSVLLRGRTNIRYPEDEIARMRRSFAKALAHAFVAENAKKKANQPGSLWYAQEVKSKEIEKIRTISMKSLPIKDQELVVQRMLD